jgi:hypothetical protein
MDKDNLLCTKTPVPQHEVIRALQPIKQSKSNPVLSGVSHLRYTGGSTVKV